MSKVALAAEAGRKSCSRCAQVLPLEGFRLYRGRREAACKACRRADAKARYWADPEKHRARQRAYERDPRNRRHTNFYKNVNLRHKYGLSLDEFLARLDSQGFQCAICGASLGYKTANVDHDHACCPGKRSCGRCVRALLCGKCNTGLGSMDDDIEKLESASAYLREWAHVQPQ